MYPPASFITASLIGTLFLAWIPSVCAQDSILITLRSEHPRLLFTAEDQQRVEQLIESEPLLADLVEVIELYSEQALSEPVFDYVFDSGSTSPSPDPRLKDQRRAAMFRVYNLALTYRLTGDSRYAERARDDLIAGAGFPDWHSDHFLNVGEITNLMAVGYDWLHDFLSEDERAVIRRAIVNNGLEQGIEAYEGRHPESWWTTRMNNWNQVCNAGLVLGALAVADHEPDLADRILNHALASIPHAMQGYLPDGAWYEGPTYWAYGTTYQALLMSALTSALGTTAGLEHEEGYNELGKSGNFHIQTVGPTNQYFNFGDSKLVAYFSPVLFWLSREFDQPVYAWFERWLAARDMSRMRRMELMKEETLDRFLALLVTWYDERGTDLSYDDLTLDAYFEGDAAVGAMRSDWEDPNAVYLGFKGGYNQSEHGHMDIGSFVLDALGERWALDLGGDTYDALPGYFDFTEQRWHYFRTSNEGHNTLMFGDQTQYPLARVGIREFISTEANTHAVLDMTDAYPGVADRVLRGFAMLDRSRVMVQDRIEIIRRELPIRWAMITAAAIELDGPRVILRQGGQKLRAEILEPHDAVFQIESTDPGDPRQADNAGTAMLTIRSTPPPGGTMVLTVLITPIPDEAAELPVPAFRPLGRIDARSAP